MKQFLFLFFFSSFFFNNEHTETTVLDFNELISHSDIVAVAMAVDQCKIDAHPSESYIKFQIKSHIKGGIEDKFIVNADMLYQGDIPQNLKTLESFSLNYEYLLFLQENANSYTLLNQYTLQKVESNQEDLLIPIIEKSDPSNKTVYAKSKLLQAIEAFVYNETEILSSEITAHIDDVK